MSAIRLTIDEEGTWANVADRVLHDCGTVVTMAALEGGTAFGRPAVMIRLDMPNGEIAYAQLTLDNLLVAVDALRARYGNPA